jgi:hypothetical protein
MRFDYKDFAANPNKYKLFKTATMATTLFGADGDDVAQDTIVALTYRGVVRNQLYKRDEPIYALNTGHVVYANTLKDFVL